MMTEKESTCDIEVIYSFPVSREKVFDAWLDPDLVQMWFGPGLGETQPVEIDPEVGGKFRIVQVRDGTPVGHSGKYLALEKPNHLAFTWSTDDDEGSDVVHIFITMKDEGSSVRLIHTIDEKWKEYSDNIRESWLSMLKEMDKILT